MMTADAPRDEFHSSAADTVRRACDRLEKDPTESMIGDVSTAAIVFTRELRDHGLLPEQMLVTLKAVLCDTGLLALGRPSDVAGTAWSLYQQVITRCIDAYFQSPASQ
jgi:hypothetical protein